MTSPKSILVLGAGELGNAVLDAILSHPSFDDHSRLSALLRVTSSPAKRSQIADLESRGITVVDGDIVVASEQKLSELFKPFHTIIGCTGMTYPPGTQVKIGKAVLAAGIQRYFPWQFGVDYDVIGPSSSQNLFTEQLEVRALLREQSQTRWVIVSTGMFTSFLFEPVFGVVSADRRTVHALGSWENQVTVTVPKDIGRVVAELALQAQEIEGVVYTAGDTVSYRRVAEIVETVLGKEVSKVKWTIEILKAQLAKDPDNGMRKYRVVFAEGKGVSWDVKETFNAKRRLKLETAEEWATKNLSV